MCILQRVTGKTMELKWAQTNCRVGQWHNSLNNPNERSNHQPMLPLIQRWVALVSKQVTVWFSLKKDCKDNTPTTRRLRTFSTENHSSSFLTINTLINYTLTLWSLSFNTHTDMFIVIVSSFCFIFKIHRTILEFNFKIYTTSAISSSFSTIVSTFASAWTRVQFVKSNVCSVIRSTEVHLRISTQNSKPLQSGVTSILKKRVLQHLRESESSYSKEQFYGLTNTYTIVDLRQKVIYSEVESGLADSFSEENQILLKPTTIESIDKMASATQHLRHLTSLADITFPQTIVLAPVFEPMMTVIDKIANGIRVPPNISMRYEMLRLCSLRTYPTENKPFLIRYAQAGFYYASNGDEVVCYCCGKRISNWKAEDEPIEIHRRVSPSCSFIINNSAVNVPAGSNTSSNSQITQQLSRDSEHPNNDDATEPTRTQPVSSVTVAATGSSDDVNTVNANRDSPRSPEVINASIASVNTQHTTMNQPNKEREINEMQNSNTNAGSLPLSGRDEENILFRHSRSNGQFVSMPQQHLNRAIDNEPRHTSVTTAVESHHSLFKPQNRHGEGIQASDSNLGTNANSIGAERLGTSGQQSSAAHTPSTGLPISQSSDTRSHQSETPSRNNKMPKNPRYATKTARLESFTVCSSIAVTPERLSEAGLFYAGTADCTRCFHCGIGLRHWSSDDDPWVEHARFSIDCEFVRKKKGEEFVHLIRLALAYTENAEAINTPPTSEVPAQPTIEVPAPVTPPSLEDENPTADNTDEDVRNLLKTDAAQSVRENGYDDEMITKALKLVITLNGRSGITAACILEQIFAIEEGTVSTSESAKTQTSEHNNHPTRRDDSKLADTNTITEYREGQQAAVSQLALTNLSLEDTRGVTGTSSDIQKSISQPVQGFVSLPAQAVSRNKSADLESRSKLRSKRRQLKKENDTLKMMSVCSVCKTNNVSIVFLPCGHLVTCEDCAPSVRKCFICSQVIKGTVRTWRV